MNTLKVIIPEAIYKALLAEAAKAGISIDAVASVFLLNAVTHTCCSCSSVKK